MGWTYHLLFSTYCKSQTTVDDVSQNGQAKCTLSSVYCVFTVAIEPATVTNTHIFMSLHVSVLIYCEFIVYYSQAHTVWLKVWSWHYAIKHLSVYKWQSLCFFSVLLQLASCGQMLVVSSGAPRSGCSTCKIQFTTNKIHETQFPPNTGELDFDLKSE